MYIHIPFCASRCAYCDFHSGTDLRLMQRLVSAECREMEMRKDYLHTLGIPDRQSLPTLYLGGGTPSMLTPELLDQLLRQAETVFGRPRGEVTIEANPDDVTPTFMSAIRSTYINRISMGVQSFFDDDLRMLNRRHTAEQARRAVGICKENGLTNISVDLIYALPFQTLERWEHNIDQALALQVPHLSAYCLSIEEGTPLSLKLENGEIQSIEDEKCAEMYEMLCKKLTQAGYHHYELSNFALPGYEAQHNSSYWDGTPYIGIGPAAHSFDGESRQWNIANTKKYIEAIEQGLIPSEKEELSADDAYNELIMTRLRTSKGLNLNELREKFPNREKHCLANAQTALKAGNLEWMDENTLRLTQKGIFVSDAVMSELFV
ncbi:MAG: radical SAM family heme chaperone HemW [Paludibacteraceae bacterium]|nr:radical SAM family heme chaperone HemW [Paludibacteraceae bacterium]